MTYNPFVKEFWVEDAKPCRRSFDRRSDLAFCSMRSPRGDFVLMRSLIGHSHWPILYMGEERRKGERRIKVLPH